MRTLFLPFLGLLVAIEAECFVSSPALRSLGSRRALMPLAQRRSRGLYGAASLLGSNNVQADEEAVQFAVGEGTEAKSQSRWEQW